MSDAEIEILEDKTWKELKEIWKRLETLEQWKKEEFDNTIEITGTEWENKIEKGIAELKQKIESIETKSTTGTLEFHKRLEAFEQEVFDVNNDSRIDEALSDSDKNSQEIAELKQWRKEFDMDMFVSDLYNRFKERMDKWQNALNQSVEALEQKIEEEIEVRRARWQVLRDTVQVALLPYIVPINKELG